jgi:hypothetical protein
MVTAHLPQLVDHTYASDFALISTGVHLRQVVAYVIAGLSVCVIAHFMPFCGIVQNHAIKQMFIFQYLRQFSLKSLRTTGCVFLTMLPWTTLWQCVEET